MEKAIADPVTYGRLREALRAIGFSETRKEKGSALRHAESGAIFLFRPYGSDDKLQPAEVFLVAQEMELRGILEPESFDALLTSTLL